MRLMLSLTGLVLLSFLACSSSPVLIESHSATCVAHVSPKSGLTSALDNVLSSSLHVSLYRYLDSVAPDLQSDQWRVVFDAQDLTLQNIDPRNGHVHIVADTNPDIEKLRVFQTLLNFYNSEYLPSAEMQSFLSFLIDSPFTNIPINNPSFLKDVTSLLSELRIRWGTARLSMKLKMAWDKLSLVDGRVYSDALRNSLENTPEVVEPRGDIKPVDIVPVFEEIVSDLRDASLLEMPLDDDLTVRDFWFGDYPLEPDPQSDDVAWLQLFFRPLWLNPLGPNYWMLAPS